MKRLSIIVPLYNSAQYLPKCIGSLVQQDIPLEDYEIILVNDGSPDNSEEMAREYASAFSNIVVVSQQNKGTSGARNTGIRVSTGKYLYFVDPDDYILENSLKALLDQMDENDLDVLRFGYTEVDEEYKPTQSCKHPERPDYSPKIMDGYTFMGERLGTACYVWTFLYKASIIKDNDLYCLEGDYFDDTPWLPRVLAKANRVDSVPTKRHFYLIRSNSLVQSKNMALIKRKVDGHLFLVDELGRQASETQNKDGRKWYRMMITSCVLSLLTLVGKYYYSNKKSFIGRLRERKVFPLCWNRFHWHNKFKLLLINISPSVYCWLIHIR